MINRPFLLMPAALLFSSVIFAQVKNAEPETAVQQTIRDAFEALSARDSVAFRSHCTARPIFIEYGRQWNTDTLVEKAIRRNKATDFRRVNTLTFIRTTVKENSAWLVYDNKAAITADGKSVNIHWIETAVLTMENKQWKIDQLHSTLIQRE